MEVFRAHFAGADAQYVLIGGAACDLVLTDAGLDARATKDFDIVLVIEAIDGAFFQLLSQFIDAGGYEARQHSSGKREFFRFVKPTNPDYPKMLEIFSRRAEGLTLPEGMVLTPVPEADDILSLSAIILDDDYYALLQSLSRIVEGVRVLDERALIPFKARAHIDLRRRKQEGAEVKNEDIVKHKADVFRLGQLLPGDAAINLAPAIAEDLAQFLDLAAADDDFDPRGSTREEAVARIRRAYSVR